MFDDWSALDSFTAIDLTAIVVSIATWSYSVVSIVDELTKKGKDNDSGND